MDQREKMTVANLWRDYGGHFLARLGEALAAADPANAQKIRDCWAAEWAEYLEIGQRLQQLATPAPVGVETWPD